MIRPIVQLGDPILTTSCRMIEPAELSSGPILALIRDMAETLEVSGGVGLAAPQVGESVRLILASSFPSVQSPDRPFIPVHVLINPRIIAHSTETEAGWEGCLSFLQYKARVVRHVDVTVAYLSPTGEPGKLNANGFFARVLQHEMDHLDGILTLHRAATPDDIVEISEI